MADRHPLFAFDRALGARLVIGADEAGRGCIAGPIVGAAVCWDLRTVGATLERLLEELDDSKALNARQREKLAPLIREHAAAFAVVRVTPAVIDRIGIQRANYRVLEQAIRRVATQLDGCPGRIRALTDHYRLPGGLEHTPVTRGDQQSAAIAAAAVLAKTTRDRLMRAAERRFPGFGFDEHAGYMTARHVRAVADLGLTPLHRRSFRFPGNDAA